MAIGFEGAVGNEGLFATIRQQIADRMAQQAQTHAMSVEDQKLQIEKDRFAQEATDRALLRQQQSTALNETLGEKSATSLGAGQTVLSPTDPTANAIMNSSQRSNMRADTSLPSTQLARGVPLVSGQTGISPELSARFQNTTLAPLVKTETPEATQSPEATAPTVTEKPSVLTGNLRFMGTPAANAAENTRFMRGQLLSDPSLTPQQKIEMQAESVGLKAPTREPKVVPKQYEVSTPGPNGLPIKKLVDEATLQAGVPEYQKPEGTKAVDQNKLEQEYRTVLARGLSSRSGGLGLEDAKVQQANHLTSLLDQSYDPKTGNWNIPRVQLNELALGLARLVSPGGQAGEGMLREFQQRTAKGDLAGALTYLTGEPIAANTQAITKYLKDSIDRQGSVAEQNREGEMRYLRGLAPTELEESRRQSMEATSLNPLRKSRVIQNSQTGERKLQVSVDGGKSWQ